jgi:hypothetical protein
MLVKEVLLAKLARKCAEAVVNPGDKKGQDALALVPVVPPYGEAVG